MAELRQRVHKVQRRRARARAVAGAGDIDGDGDAEYAISAPGEEDGAGVVYIAPGFYSAGGMFELNDPISDVSSVNANRAVRIVGAAGDGL